MNKILSNIQKERKKQNISNEEMAKFIGYKDASSYWKVENGVNSLSLNIYLKICQKLKQSPVFFLRRNVLNKNRK